MTNTYGNRDFNLQCAFKYGGFSKVPDAYADVLHSYFSLAGLSMMGLDSQDLLPIDPSLGMTIRASHNPQVCIADASLWLQQ